jgi:predicted DNA-binding transcriptional regulator YafY
VSRRRLERLLNLTMCLMATSRFLTVAEIGEMVEGYEPGESDDEQEAFRRMFERDKQHLRELGIPLETGSESAFSDEVGYRIRRSAYALPEISLDADEAAALALASTLWSNASLAAPAASALRKLVAGGAAPFDGELGGPALPGLDALEPRVGATEAAFEPTLAAVQQGRAIKFPYRKLGEASPVERHVEPWGVVSWRGRWYLVGFDRTRRAERVFRLSRVTGPVRPAGKPGAVTVPPGTDLRAMVSRSYPMEQAWTATLLVRPGTGHSLRRFGRIVQPAASTAGAGVGGGTTSAYGHRRTLSAGGDAVSASGTVPAYPAHPTMDVLEIDYSDTERLARWVVGHGPDVLVVAPAGLRKEVVRRLRSALAIRPAGIEADALSEPAPR